MKPWKKLLICAVLCALCLAGAFTSQAAETEETPETGAEASIVVDADTGAVLYDKNMDEREYPASITKVLTALVALENSSLDETVTFSRNAVCSIEPGSTHIGMREGEQLTMEQCLYALLMASANEVANAIGEHVGGSIEGFAQMMNDKAARLGCTNSHFVNPNGLHDDDHYTTPHDMALITREALKNDEFRKIIATYSYVVPATNLVNENRPIQNHHQMLPQRKYPYDGCIGGKTGYTSKALYTLVTCAERDDMTLICVEMRSETPCYDSTARLLDYGFANFKKIPAAEDMASRTDAYKELLEGANIAVDEAAPYLALSGEDYIVLPEDYVQERLLMEYVPAAQTDGAETDNTAGYISYTYNGVPVGSAAVITTPSKDNSIIKGVLPMEKSKKRASSAAKTHRFLFIFSFFLMLMLLLLAVFICFKYNGKKK